MTDENQDFSSFLDLALGKTQSYPDTYDPSLLQVIPRDLSRRHLPAKTIEFNGVDIWTAYELSWLDESGKPQVAIAEFRVPSNSPNIIESKSFKYYLNSINQVRFANHSEVKSVIGHDLSSIVKAPVELQFFTLERYRRYRNNSVMTAVECIDDYPLISDETPRTMLSKRGAYLNNTVLVSHLLKTNCPVTGQPDWASIWLGYSGQRIMPDALLSYFVSFRMHQDFHEHCVERIYSDLIQICQPERLWVYARYTRRGGLDINPFRSSESMLPPLVWGARQ